MKKLTGIFSASLKLEYVDSGLNILSKMEIILYTRCYRSAGKKSPDPDPYHCYKVSAIKGVANFL